MYNNKLSSPSKTVSITEAQLFALENKANKDRVKREEAVSLPGETWRQVSDSWYHVSDLGRVKKRWTSIMGDTKEFLITVDGRNMVRLLFENKTIQNINIGRLVKLCFHFNSAHETLRVIYKDCNKKNHRLDNLSWSTHSEAVQHYHDNCQCKKPRLKSVQYVSKTGSLKERRVIISTGDLIRLKEMINAGIKQSVIAQAFGVDCSYVSRIKNGKLRNKS